MKRKLLACILFISTALALMGCEGTFKPRPIKLINTTNINEFKDYIEHSGLVRDLSLEFETDDYVYNGLMPPDSSADAFKMLYTDENDAESTITVVALNDTAATINESPIFYTWNLKVTYNIPYKTNSDGVITDEIDINRYDSEKVGVEYYYVENDNGTWHFELVHAT